MQKKYGVYRLEAACKRAVFFHNYSYSGIKTILEKELDKRNDLFIKNNPEKQLSAYYARNIKELLKEISDGNICTN